LLPLLDYLKTAKVVFVVSRKTYALSSGALLLFLILGNALTGITPIGIHEDCKDGIDNSFAPLPGDGDIDAEDDQCVQYPFEDGNGEFDTPSEQRYTGDSYASLASYHIEYAADPLDTVCTALAFTTYVQPSDIDEAQAYADENGGCVGGGP
jgi:hypothetical protein